MRRMAADTSAPDWRTINCHADSPLELFTCTFHNPAIEGTFAASVVDGVKRLAWNGYGAPRVPREDCPSSRPSLTLASSLVSYSSKLRTSEPLSKLPAVEVSFSSPLKNDPLTVDPVPALSKRKGTSTSLTMTLASHRPLTDCASARAGSEASAASATTNPST